MSEILFHPSIPHAIAILPFTFLTSFESSLSCPFKTGKTADLRHHNTLGNHQSYGADERNIPVTNSREHTHPRISTGAKRLVDSWCDGGTSGGGGGGGAGPPPPSLDRATVAVRSPDQNDWNISTL
ncbi:hypothetical protein BZA05DRAFT_433202 [Tricharina praecox]|uniref:uncharacterized protein n=1 Tax=Tricharina praecox TaxID=43433 RepID=UPI00222090A9|nr:uncharacterized protein BZA05DRAFT_433202 [Tricharina praecox]KAI5857780.1 hypothetical protein BZA05DRAFT_433202 [Tricharina praecox]